MQTLTPEQLVARQQCEMVGMFNTRRGIVQYYCSVLGLPIQEAKESIDLECELRGIPLETPKPKIQEPPKDFWDKAENIMSKGAVIIEKYPIIKEIGTPLLKTAIAAGSAAFIGAFTGNKVADETEEPISDDNSPILDIEDLDVQQEEKGQRNENEIPNEEFEVVK